MMVQATVTPIWLQWRRIPFISEMMIGLLLWSGCEQKSQDTKQLVTDSIPTYQQYSYNKIRNFMANDGGYTPSDSFRISTFGNSIYFTGKIFVTKTVDSFNIVYLFWQANNGNPVIDFERKFLKPDLPTDSVLDINGDKQNDFTVYSQTRNGNCQPYLADVFIADTVNNKFIPIDKFEQIPNPVFDAKHKKVFSIMTCNYKIDKCIYQWKGNTLSEISCKTESVK